MLRGAPAAPRAPLIRRLGGIASAQCARWKDPHAAWPSQVEAQESADDARPAGGSGGKAGSSGAGRIPGAARAPGARAKERRRRQQGTRGSRTGTDFAKRADSGAGRPNTAAAEMSAQSCSWRDQPIDAMIDATARPNASRAFSDLHRVWRVAAVLPGKRRSSTGARPFGRCTARRTARRRKGARDALARSGCLPTLSMAGRSPGRTRRTSVATSKSLGGPARRLTLDTKIDVPPLRPESLAARELPLRACRVSPTRQLQSGCRPAPKARVPPGERRRLHPPRQVARNPRRCCIVRMSACPLKGRTTFPATWRRPFVTRRRLASAWGMLFATTGKGRARLPPFSKT